MEPTFIGIGSARCGSTWLHRSLGLHPEIQVSDPKQVCYFDNWIRTRPIEWYLDHFDPPSGQSPAPVRGEVTPFYSRLSKRSVDSVLRRFPELRILLTIRNPVDRCWSAAHLDFGHYGRRQLSALSPATFYRYFERQRVIRYTNYEQVIDRWSAGNPQRLHVCIFDEIRSDPLGLLAGIYAHVGADASWQPPLEDVARRVRPEGRDHQDQAIPEPIRWYLSQKWIDATRRLNDRLGGRVSGWVDSMDEVVGNPVTRWRLQRAFNLWVGRRPEQYSFAAYDWLNERRLSRSWKRIQD